MAFYDNCVVKENSKDMLHIEWKYSASIHRNYDSTPNQSNKHRSLAVE